MRPQPFEYDSADDEDGTGEQPVVEGQHVVPLPEPDMIDEALPVPLDNVVDRIELDHVEILHRQDLGRPENRRHPEEKLQDHADDLPHVAKEQNDG